MDQFEFRFTGKGPNMSLKNRTNSTNEIIAIHHGLSTIGNNKTSSHTHQGARDHRLLPDFVAFADRPFKGKSTPEFPLDSKVIKSHVNGLEFQTDSLPATAKERAGRDARAPTAAVARGQASTKL